MQLPIPRESVALQADERRATKKVSWVRISPNILRHPFLVAHLLRRLRRFPNKGFADQPIALMNCYRR